MDQGQWPDGGLAKGHSSRGLRRRPRCRTDPRFARPPCDGGVVASQKSRNRGTSVGALARKSKNFLDRRNCRNCKKPSSHSIKDSCRFDCTSIDRAPVGHQKDPSVAPARLAGTPSRILTAATMMWRMPLPARQRSPNSADTTRACAGCQATTTTPGLRRPPGSVPLIGI